MIRIYVSKSKATLKAAVLASAFLLFAAVTSFAQVVNLTAGPATAAMPDGTIVPMWGYTCGAAALGSTATCAPLSGSTSLAGTGSLGGIYVLNGGSGYTSAPTVTIAPAAGNTGTPTAPTTVTAVVSGGQVVGINLSDHGSGYTAAPTVTITGGAGLVSGRDHGSSGFWCKIRKPDDQPDQQPFVRDSHSYLNRDYRAGGRRSWRDADHGGESGPLQRTRVPDLVYRCKPAGYPMHKRQQRRFGHSAGPGESRAVDGCGSCGGCAGNSHGNPTNVVLIEAGHLSA
jgi:hypothetical protein